MNDYVTSNKLSQYRKDEKPEKCPILDVADFKPVVDHDHVTGKVRGVISSEGNVLIGKIENCFRSRCVDSDLELPNVLRRIALYLEQDQGPYHPVGVRQLVKRFARMVKEDQYTILLTHYCVESIEECSNSTDRAKLYRKMLVGEQ